MIIEASDLEQMTDERLASLEDLIDEVQQARSAADPIDVERRKVIAGIRKGLINFQNSRTLIDFLSKE